MRIVSAPPEPDPLFGAVVLTPEGVNAISLGPYGPGNRKHNKFAPRRVARDERIRVFFRLYNLPSLFKPIAS